MAKNLRKEVCAYAAADLAWIKLNRATIAKVKKMARNEEQSVELTKKEIKAAYEYVRSLEAAGRVFRTENGRK